MIRVFSGRLVLVGAGIAVLGYVLVVLFGNVTDVQSAVDSEAFSDAAVAGGNRLRLALLFDMVVFVPGYLLVVWCWSKWRMQLLQSAGAVGDSAGVLRSAKSVFWFYRLAPFGIAIAAVADLVENCVVYVGLGTVDLNDVVAATMVVPAELLIVLLRIVAAVKWLFVALVLFSLVIAGVSELFVRRRVR